MNTTGPSSWRRVQALWSTADGGIPRSSNSSLKAASSSPPPFAPQRPSPGVAQTKIWHTFLMPRFYAAARRSPIEVSGYRLRVSLTRALSKNGIISQGRRVGSRSQWGLPDACSHRVQGGWTPMHTALEARHRQAGLRALLDASCRAGLLGLVGDRFGDGGGDPLVEDGRDDVVLREVFCRDHAGNRLGGGELHRLVYLTGPDVEGAPEDTWEAKDVVDLVRVVAASRGDDPRFPHGDLGSYLRIRVGHGEDDRVLVHALDVLYGEHVRRREPEEEVGPGDAVGEVAGPPLGIGVLGEPPLGLVEVLAPLVNDALGVAADDILCARRHHDLGACYPRGADAVHDHAEALHLFSHDLEGVDQGRQHHYRRAVLVVVEDGDVKLFLQALFDLEAPRGRDILQVYAAEGRRKILYGLDYGVRILGVEADRERVDVRELLE